MEPQQNVSVAGHPKNHLYIDIGVFVHNLFNQELLGSIIQLDWIIKIQAGGKPIHLSQIGPFHKALWHLPLLVNDYHYDENTITNLLPLAKLVDEYYIFCNTTIDNVIYVQSKDNGKYIQFQRDFKYSLCYMGISDANVGGHC